MMILLRNADFGLRIIKFLPFPFLFRTPHSPFRNIVPSLLIICDA
jgi:hypothetical protein